MAFFGAARRPRQPCGDDEPAIMEDMTNFLRSFSSATGTLSIMAVCCVVFVAQQFFPLVDEGSLWGPAVSTQPYRLGTYAFLHVDLNHVVINMLMLALLGREVEAWLGTRLFFVAYVLGIGGSAAAVLWQDYNAPTVGASGALYALMAVLIGAQWRRRGDVRAAIVLVAVNVAYSLIVPGLSLWGHVGGLAAGLVFTVAVLAFQSARTQRSA